MGDAIHHLDFAPPPVLRRGTGGRLHVDACCPGTREIPVPALLCRGGVPLAVQKLRAAWSALATGSGNPKGVQPSCLYRDGCVSYYIPAVAVHVYNFAIGYVEWVDCRGRHFVPGGNLAGI